MRVQVVDWGINTVHRHLHAAHCTFARRSNHVCTIRGCAVANDFSIDVSTTRQRVFQLFNHYHTAAASDNETVTVSVVSTGGFFRGVVVFSRQRTHRVEFAGHFPAQLFAAASKHDVLFAQLDLLYCVTDTVCGSRTRGADGVVNAMNFKRRGEAGRNAGCHRFGDHIRANRFQAARAAHCVSAENLETRGAAAGTCNQANARVILVSFRGEASICNCLLHRKECINGCVAHKAHNFAVNEASGIQFYVAPDVATHAGILQLLRESDP